MPRTKVNYAAQGLFVGPSPATGSHYTDGQNCYGSGSLVNELYRIQGYSYDFSFNKEGLGQFGDLANIDYLNLVWPNVNLNFNYLLSNFGNEKNIGFVISSGNIVNSLSGIIAGNTEDKNYFITIHSPDGQELHNNPDFNYNSPGTIIGFGNGFVTNYTSKAGVGQLPTVDLTVEALNVKVYDKNASLYSLLMENNLRNGGLDDVGTGGNILVNQFNNWSTSANDTALVKIIADPINTSVTPNSDVLLIANPNMDAYFIASGTGTNWTTNNTGSFFTKLNNQLIYSKIGQISTEGRLSSGNFIYLPSNKWYKVVLDVASGTESLNSIKCNFGGPDSPNFTLSSGVNIFYNTGDPTPNTVFSMNFPSVATTGTVYFNEIKILEPKNFSAKFYATGSTGTSFNMLYKSEGTLYDFLNSSSGLNKRFILSADIKFSGFDAYSEKDLIYFSLGNGNNAIQNSAGVRQPIFTTSNSGQFGNISLTLSNSNGVNNDNTKDLRVIRFFDAPDGQVWIDNIKLTQTNITDIINGNKYNGSFEVYHPSSVNSGNGTISIFSGLEINQNSAFTPYLFITGSSSVPSFDRNLTYSDQSLNVRLTNVTGNNNYLTIYPFMGSYGTFVANKRHKFNCYTKNSGTADVTFEIGESSTSNTFYSTLLDNDNAWQYHEGEIIPTGNTIPKFAFYFNSANTGSQLWVDDINLYYYDDCYVLPTVENVSGGFNIPVNSTTNYSGLQTNRDSKSLSVLRPQDVYLNLSYSDMGPVISDWKLQSYELSIPIPRENIYKIGQQYPQKKLQTPISATLSLNAVLGDLATGDLRDYYLSCNKTYNIDLGITTPCANSSAIEYKIKRACLTSMEFTNTIGNNKTATMNFIVPIGSVRETGCGIFMSGITFN